MSLETSETLGATGDRHTSDAMICSTCRDLLIRPDEAIEENIPASYDFRMIVTSAAGGCPICEISYAELKYDEDPDTLQITLFLDFEEEPVLDESPSKFLARSLSVKTDRDNGPERFSILLGKALSYGPISQIHEENSTYHPAHPTEGLPVRTPLSTVYTGDPECLQQVAEWLQDCVVSHKYCNPVNNTENSIIRPARLLEIHGTAARLTSTTEMSPGGALSYITVSHKWAARGMPKLLSINIAAMQEFWSVQTLPAVFENAITLAKALNIRFVWIDALCIIQDDPKDLQTEIANMGHIYRNATLNVGALKTAKYGKSTPGLFVKRNPHKYSSSFALRIQRAGFKGDYLALCGIEISQLEDSHLMKRGWVLQERVLSRRSVYFGGQIWWECCEKRANEVWPNGVFGFTYDPVRPSFRIPNLLGKKSSNYWALREENEIYCNWHRIVRTFTQCDLSFEQDYLVALSGLAQDFKAALDDEYYAGLWAKDMIRGLLWYRWTFHYKDHAVRPKQYRAPSWSWASVNLPVEFFPNFFDSLVIIAYVLEVVTVPTAADSMGRIEDGWLRISGHLRHSSRTLCKRYTRHVKTWSMDELPYQYEWFEEGYCDDGSRSMDKCSFFLMAYRKPTREVFLPIGNVYGLILEYVDQDKSVYRRIGAFQHVWGEERTSMDNPLPEDYPEFLDFDPENFERHTITII